MKGKLYETLIGTDARLAITISGEELKEFVDDVMADARLRAESCLCDFVEGTRAAMSYMTDSDHLEFEGISLTDL